jgi:hypothetical protein
MFFGKKERDLVKQVNDELAERVIGQPIAYYPISIEESNFNDIYGESIDKVSLPPVRVYAYVVVENEQTNERYGYEYQTKLTVNFSSKRLTADQNLYVRVGDFVQYGDFFYEIVRTYNDTRYYFGQVEHKFQIGAECVRAREGAFRVVPGLDRPVTAPVGTEVGSSPAPRELPYPPLNATYITLTPNSRLPYERVITAGAGIALTDGGAGGALTIAATGQNATGPTGSVQFQTGGGSFSGSADLTFLAGSTRLGIGTATPTHALTVMGSMSASADVNVGGDLVVRGTVIGASPLKISGSINIVNNAGTTIAVLGSSSLGPDVLSSSLGVLTNLTASGYVSASYFYGDGSTLTGIATSGGIFTTLNGSNAYVTSSLNIGGTSTPAAQLQVSSSGDQSLFQVDGATNGSILFVTGSGRVGIGTDDPDYALDVAGDIGVDQYIYHNGDANTYLNFTNDRLRFFVGGISYIDLNDAGSAPHDVTINDGGNNVDFIVKGNGSNKGNPLFKTDASTGRVGINGVGSPSWELDVDGDIGLSEYIYHREDEDTYIRFPTGDKIHLVAGGVNFLYAWQKDADVNKLIFNEDNTDTDIVFRSADGANNKLVYLDASTHRVGIGTGFPSHLLTVAGASHLSGGIVHKRTTVATSYTASISDYILGVSAVPTSILCDATSFANGQVVVIKDESGNASSATPITLNASASQTVDGEGSAIIESPYGAVLLYSNGSNWFVY